MVTYTCTACGIQVRLENASEVEADFKVCLCEAPITAEVEATLTIPTGG